MGWGSETAGGSAARLALAFVAAVVTIASTKMVPEAVAQARGPVPNGRLTSGVLSFDGHATAGDFIGTTKVVAGQLTGAPDLSGVQGWVEAPVESLKTGNGKRDKDLNKSMESSRYPKLRFDLRQITAKQFVGDSVPVTLHGTLDIHGVTRRVELPGTIRFQGASARVRSDFPLNLKDYRIGGLSKMLGILKMNENIKVHVDLVFQLGPGG
jgi:polyisoprenoid-binding protein YceI